MARIRSTSARRGYRIHINLATGEVDANFNTGSSGSPQWAEVAQVHGVEDVVGSRFDDVIIGSGGDNRLDGGGGNDVIHAGAGNDTLIGGTGTNTLDGGDGSDTADYSSSAHSVFALLNDGGGVGTEIDNLQSATHFSMDTFVSIENLTGSSHNDWLLGDDNTNVINGGGGDDRSAAATAATTPFMAAMATTPSPTVAPARPTCSAMLATTSSMAVTATTSSTAAPATTRSSPAVAATLSRAATATTGSKAARVPITWTAAAALIPCRTSIRSAACSLTSAPAPPVVVLRPATRSRISRTWKAPAHNDTLIGSNQDNVLFESAGTNLLIGGGGHDTFAFMDFTESHNTVLDFHIGEDKLAIVGNDTMADLHFTQTGAGTLVSFDNSQATIMLTGVNAQDFQAHSSTDIEFSQTLDPLLHG